MITLVLTATQPIALVLHSVDSTIYFEGHTTQEHQAPVSRILFSFSRQFFDQVNIIVSKLPLLPRTYK